jgi:tripartite ATP-independent transporter DctP family solute receptor
MFDLLKTASAAAAFAGALTAMSGSASALEIKAADVHGPGYPTVAAMEYMGELLSEWTDGRITVTVYGNMQLGGEKEYLEQAQLGALEIARVSNGVIGPLVDDFNAFNLPYVFRGVDHMHKVLDGPIGQDLLLKLEDSGLIALGYMDAGSRSFYNDVRPINAIEDLDGLKIRVMQNPAFVEMVNSMGGNGIPYPFNELYTGLQTRVVDGAENNPPTYLSKNHYEVAKYYTLTEHLMVPEVFVFSKVIWDTLPEEDQQLIRKAGTMAAAKQREFWAAKEAEALEQLKAEGYEVVTDIDKTDFINATASVREKFGSKYTDLIAAIAAVE